jgi:DNA/RNA endonuclease YhcR with UshA esterase domain
MWRRKGFITTVALSLSLFTLLSIPYAEEKYITPEEAYKYVGETKTVCGTVTSATYAVRSRGKPTFLNLNKPYPNHIFTIVIWGSNRDKFKNPPEVFFKRKEVCVTGLITTYRGKPQIEVEEPSQITIKSD